MAARVILLLAFTAFLFGGAICADDLKLAGSSLATKDATSKADAIFVGKITDLGDVELDSLADTRGASVKVLQILRGKVVSQLGVEIDTIPFSTDAEQVPKVGNLYIFFINKGSPRPIVLKLLPATADNIKTVKTAIVQARLQTRINEIRKYTTYSSPVSN